MNKKRLLLCTDMDRTVIPNGTQPEHPDARKRFNIFCQHPDVRLVYVTGRDKTLTQQAIKDYDLPHPNYAITDVGTRIYDINNSIWTELTLWENEISKSWNGKNHHQIKMLFADIRVLRLQESAKQSTFKLSYYLSLSIDKDDVINQMKKRLQDNNINADLIWSIDEISNIGLLDILPANATKLHAIEFLQHRLNYGIKETVFAGDSGNDLPVLISPIQSVLVDNASEDIKSTALNLAQKNGNADALYIAQAKKCGMNANYAAGILEGIAHFTPDFYNDFLANSTIK